MKDTINPDCLNYSEVLSVYSTKKAAEEDIKKLERRVKSSDKEIVKKKLKGKK